MVHFSCTACNAKIKSAFEANFHPLIDCLVCRKCYFAYGNGDFATLWEDGVDEAGDDNYCRWCCDGGELYGCMNDERPGEDRCHYSFCKDCIVRNLPDDKILEIENLSDEEKDKIKWLCYACDKTKISKLREQAQAAMKSFNEKEEEERKKKKSTSEPNSQSAKKRRTEIEPSTIKASNNIKTPTTSTVPTISTTSTVTTTSTTSTITKAPTNNGTTTSSVLPTGSTVSTNSTVPTNTKTLNNSTGPNIIKAPTISKAPTTIKAITNSATTVNSATTTKTTASANSTAPLTSTTSANSPVTTKTDLKSKVTPDINIVPINKIATAKTVDRPKISKDLVTTPVNKPVVARPVNRLKVSKDVTIVPVAKKSAPTPNDNRTSMTTSSAPAAESTINTTKPTTTAPATMTNGKPKAIKLRKEEIKIKLDAFRKLKDVCIEEVNNRFENVVKMYMSQDKQPSELTINEVTSIREPVANIDMLLNDLKLLEGST